MASTRYYVGHVKHGEREIFRFAKEPTQKTHGDKYKYVIGPFSTKAGATVMAKYGENNPHLQTVADAERMAKQWRAAGKTI